MLDFARIIYDPDLESFLLRLRPGAYGLDSATYYVAKATLVHQTKGREAAVPQYDSARVLLTRMRLEAPTQAWIYALLGTVHAGLDEPVEAIGYGKRAVELLPSEADALDGPEFLSELATIYVMLGDMENAAQCFDRALAMPSWISTHSLRVDPFLKPLHRSPEFQALVTKWGAPGGATLASPVGTTSCP
jgi:tetratricopeptide (TPR) repeat protein